MYQAFALELTGRAKSCGILAKSDIFVLKRSFGMTHESLYLLTSFTSALVALVLAVILAGLKIRPSGELLRYGKARWCLAGAFAAYAAFSPLEDIGTDTPFSGTYVPLDHYNTDRRVSSVMIELRRDQYLTEKSELVDIAAENLGAMLGRLVDAADRGSR